jgi:hypothetical protein
MLDSVLQKASTGVDPQFIDIWVPIIGMIQRPRRSL